MPGRFRARIGEALRQAFLLPAFTRLVVRLRHFYFVRLRRRVLQWRPNELIIAYDYSRRHIDRLVLKGRPLKLIRPLSSIETLPKTAKILSIGCRYEEEIFYLFAHGYSLRNIRGLDLFSYSPLVDTGDMHRMPYGDSTWDAVICAWTLSYSNDLRRACTEIVRVTRPGGIVAVSVGYYPISELRRLEAAGQLKGGIESRVQTTASLLDAFRPHVGTVYFQHDPAPTTAGMCAIIFSTSKSA